MKLFIMADDFTGAGDVGIQLKKYGFKVCTCIDLNMKELECDVAIIDTDTRNKTAEKAFDTIDKIMKNVDMKQYDKIYKKIDSTLRGNIREEVEALQKNISKDSKICIIAGFPKMGRKTINGRHYVDEKPLLETEFASILISPAKEEYLTKIFPTAKLINYEEIDDKLYDKIKNIQEQLIIFDSRNESDLDIIAKSVVEAGYDRYIVGAAGIMNYLPKYWGYEKNKVLMVSGSCSKKNKDQLERFLQNNSDIYVFKVDYKKSINKNIDEFLNNYDKKKDILICSYFDDMDSQNAINYFKIQGKSLYEVNEIIGEYLEKISIFIINKLGIKNIFLTGGETAVKVLKGLNIKYLEVCEELDTGVVYSINIDLNYKIITKPGAFGENKIYLRAYEKLKSVDNNN